MQEDVKLVLDMCNEAMIESIAYLEQELSHIRAGKASTRMLDGVTVDYYGSLVPLSQVANLNTPDARTIAIQPWEKKMISVIEKAILVANLGFNPDNNGEIVRINIPPLTEERRRDLVKQVNKEGEGAKVSIRTARKDANENLKKLQKDGLSEDLTKDAENEVQELTNKFSKQVDDMTKDKNEEILKI